MLRISDIHKSYNGLPVLKGFDLAVEKGEIVALIGPSGCGKSTLLNTIAGLVKPDQGYVSAGSEKLSYMFQDSRLLPWRSVYDNIALVRDDAPEEEVLALIRAVGLAGFEDYHPDKLSGGMIKRCALARAFHFKGDYMLMDEPFQGLDYGLRMEMLDMLINIWKEHRQGIIFVTHEIDEALTVATRIAVLARRPTYVREIIEIPGAEGRDASRPELADIRRHIIKMIT